MWIKTLNHKPTYIAVLETYCSCLWAEKTNVVFFFAITTKDKMKLLSITQNKIIIFNSWFSFPKIENYEIDFRQRVYITFKQ